jgi:tRNA(fMet)-specific endonuclease VapC
MPPTGSVLLDTNILIALLAGEAAVLEQLNTATAVYIPSIALGELYYGAQKSARASDNIFRIDELGAAAAVLGCDAETAARYGEIKAALRTRGTPIPENDIWIAAIAVQHELEVVTRDTHFDLVDGLAVTAW